MPPSCSSQKCCSNSRLCSVVRRPLLQAGQWAFAKECYSRSLALDARSVNSWANRAMVELKLCEWAEAEEDCSAALRLDPACVKVGVLWKST